MYIFCFGLVPILKKGNQQDFNNYISISILLNISKLIEKLLCMLDFTNFESQQL